MERLTNTWSHCLPLPGGTQAQSAGVCWVLGAGGRVGTGDHAGRTGHVLFLRTQDATCRSCPWICSAKTSWRHSARTPMSGNLTPYKGSQHAPTGARVSCVWSCPRSWAHRPRSAGPRSQSLPPPCSCSHTNDVPVSSIQRSP